MADIIDKHALEATGGKTYSEMDREDPARATAFQASALRTSLYTSVMAFNVGDLVIGLGALIAVLGIALSGLPRSGKSATAVIIPITLVLQFISGVFFQFSEIPTWMQTFAALFPLKWMAQGLRSVFLPDALAADEPAGSWELGRVALVLGIWCVLGLILCVRTFRWRRGER